METGDASIANGVVISVENKSQYSPEAVRGDAIVNETEVRQPRYKQFRARESLLTDLYKINHIKAIYNVFLASFILLFINIAVNDYVEYQRLRLHSDFFAWHFQGMGTMGLLWISMFGGTLVLYGCFKFWAYVRKDLQSSKWLQKFWDALWTGAYSLYHVAFLCIPPFFILRSTLAPVTTALIIIEQLRMMMKSHAFFRGNLRHVLRTEKSSVPVAQTEQPAHPNIRHFCYFHFAPTLLYRDSYPRADRIRWKLVVWRFCEFFGSAFYSIVTFEHFLYSDLQAFWDQPLGAVRVVTIFFRSLFPGLIFLILGFYAFFHSWLNAFAEMMRFADRLFYEDWWNTTRFAAYYRSWNLVVHEWIYEYMYLDIVSKMSHTPNGASGLTKPRRKSNYFISKALVFLVSALFHEYVAVLSVRFFFPMLFVLFGVVGVALMYIPNKKGAIGNIFMWLALSIGVALLLTSYCIEYYARKHCQPYEDSALDFFVPRSLSCNATIHL